MSAFMEEWEHAEDKLPDGTLALLDNVTEKHRGPLLNWLLNECRLLALCTYCARLRCHGPLPATRFDRADRADLWHAIVQPPSPERNRS
jgi:hypothetical protein